MRPVCLHCVWIRLLRLFPGSLLVLWLCTSVDARPPNVVFIMADDLGWTDLGCYGSRYYETPNIDRLASEGMRFTSGYTCGPNCAPTRAALISGQYMPRTGVYTVENQDQVNWLMQPLRPARNEQFLALDKITVAEAVKSAGYKTATFGKWHLGGGDFHPSNQGFDEAVLSEGKHFYFVTHPHVKAPLGTYHADAITDLSLDFMERHRDEPFFLIVSHFAPHYPWKAKESLVERFRDKPGVGGHTNAVYAAMIASVDESVGRILAKLEELNLSDDTLVIFTSDNGGVGGYSREGLSNTSITDNAPLRSGKGSLYEGGIRVPYIFKWPRIIEPGSVCREPINSVDFYPTLLAVTGAAPPADYPLDGVSYLDLRSNGGNSSARPAMFWHFPGYGGSGIPWTRPAGAIRDGDWKLVEFLEDGRGELYNLAEDLSETNNLFAANPEKAEELWQKLTAWRTHINAPMPERNPPGDIAPVITVHPPGRTALAGDDVLFNVCALSSTNLFYQWRRDGVDIPAATNQMLAMLNLSGTNAGVYSVLVSNSLGSVVSSNAPLAVDPMPLITTQPADQNAVWGATAIFGVGVSKTATYQWRFNGTDLTGSTRAVLRLTGVEDEAEGLYSVLVDTPYGFLVSRDAALTVIDPGITKQPLSRTNNFGTSAGFSVTAGGTPPLFYQWLFEGNVIANATNALFTRSAVTATDAGRYSVIVSNEHGSITSAAAVLTVLDPLITKQPSSRTNNAGTDALFTVAGTGSGTLGYQWRKGTNLLSDGGRIAGATSNTLRISNAFGPDAGFYSVIITGPGSSAVSANAVLTVVDPLITAHPIGLSVNAGSSGSFSVSTVATAPLSYQWRLNGVAIPGGTNRVFTVTNAQENRAGDYSVVISSPYGVATSSDALLTVVDLAPVILAQPVGKVVRAGTPVTFSVTVTGTEPRHYQWLLDGVDIPGATAGTLTIANPQTNGIGNYSVRIGNAIGTVVSINAFLNVTNGAPLITTNPASQAVNAGSAVTFSVVTIGTDPRTYQWRRGLANISGATNSSYTRLNVQRADGGNYSVVVSNSLGSVGSRAATLSVTDIAPEILLSPRDQSVLQGTQATFSVAVRGTTPFTYQWRFNGTNILGATGSNYARANIQRGSVGRYSVVISNKVGVTVSEEAVLTMIPLPPVISRQPSSRTNRVGTSATFNVAISGVSPFSYQWRYNDLDIPSATNASYTCANVRAVDAGAYTVIVGNAGGSVVSDSATLTVDTTFVPHAGLYNGLFYETNAISHQSSGFFSLTVTEAGLLEGKIVCDGGTHNVSGIFSDAGMAQIDIPRTGKNTLTADLVMDMGGENEIRGVLTDGTFIATVLGDRAVFDAITNPAAAFAGAYTLILPGVSEAVNIAAGRGYASVRIDAGGLIRLTGFLSDGTFISQSVAVSRNGDWPLYIPLYAGRGSVIGWLSVSESVPRTLEGTVSWIKDVDENSIYFPTGFVSAGPATGSEYIAPVPGTRVLDFTNAVIQLSGGILPATIAKLAILRTNNVFTVVSNDASLKLSINASNGVFSGSFVSVPGITNLVHGAVDQLRNYGAGYFLGTNQSGLVYFAE
jgi:arylsulfatase A-like enzyme